MKKDIHVLIADDHGLMRAALEMQVMQMYPAARVTVVEHLDDVVAWAKTPHDFDALLIDLGMDGPPLPDVLSLFRRKAPSCHVGVVTGAELSDVRDTIGDIQVEAIIPKGLPYEKTVSALRIFLSGGSYFPLKTEATRLYQRANEEPDAGPEDSIRRAGQGSNKDSTEILSPQLVRVLDCVAQGKSNKEIAYELGISESTVKQHVSAIMKRLGVNNRTEAAMWLKSRDR